MKVKLVGITFNLEVPELELVMYKLNEVLAKENEIMGKLEELNAKMVELKANVGALNTALDGTRAVIATMTTELAGLRSGEVLSDVVDGKLLSIMEGADAALAEVKATYNENFPPVTEPPIVEA
jgi:phage-related minor tail protein